MRTWIFEHYQNDKHGKFIPLQTIESEDFGRHFFIDLAFEFISAPSLKSGGYDESQLDLVANWTDMEGVDLSKLFDIYRDLTWKENNDNKEKAHSDMCEYMEAVENGEIEYLCTLYSDTKNPNISELAIMSDLKRMTIKS